VIDLFFIADLNIIDFKRRFKELYIKIKWKYKFIKYILKKIKKEYKDFYK